MAIYKRGREFELGTTEHKSSKWPERGSNPGAPDCESDALTTRPRLALRIRRICSSNEKYSLGLRNQEIQRVHTITHSHSSESPTRIPLVVGYHPAIRSVSSIFHKRIYILSHCQHCATLFKYIPLVTFLRTKKLDIR